LLDGIRIPVMATARNVSLPQCISTTYVKIFILATLTNFLICDFRKLYVEPLETRKMLDDCLLNMKQQQQEERLAKIQLGFVLVRYN
jgi:hypothetical protein